MDKRCVKCEIPFWRLLRILINVNFDYFEVNNHEKKTSTQNRPYSSESKYTALPRQIKLSATGSKNWSSKLSEIFSLCDSWRLFSRISQKHIKCTKVSYTQIKFYIFWLNAEILIEYRADADFKPFWKTFFDEFTNFWTEAFCVGEGPFVLERFLHTVKSPSTVPFRVNVFQFFAVFVFFDNWTKRWTFLSFCSFSGWHELVSFPRGLSGPQLIEIELKICQSLYLWRQSQGKEHETHNFSGSFSFLKISDLTFLKSGFLKTAAKCLSSFKCE